MRLKAQALLRAVGERSGGAPSQLHSWLKTSSLAACSSSVCLANKVVICLTAFRLFTKTAPFEAGTASRATVLVKVKAKSLSASCGTAVPRSFPADQSRAATCARRVPTFSVRYLRPTSGVDLSAHKPRRYMIKTATTLQPSLA